MSLFSWRCFSCAPRLDSRAFLMQWLWCVAYIRSFAHCYFEEIMTDLPAPLRTLAEAVCPLVIELTAGLLERPAPDPDAAPIAVAPLAQQLADLLAEAVPALQEAVADLDGFPLDEVDDYVEDISSPALDLVEMARIIWSAPFPPEAEGLKPYLARLAEVPVVELLGLLQPLVHAAVDPWAVFDDPETAELSLRFSGNYTQERRELAVYSQKHGHSVPPALLPSHL